MYVYIAHIIQFVFAIAGEEEQGPKSPDAPKKKKKHSRARLNAWWWKHIHFEIY